MSPTVSRSISRPVLTAPEVVEAVLLLRHLWAVILLGGWAALGLGAMTVVVGLLEPGTEAGSLILLVYAVLFVHAVRKRRLVVSTLKASVVADSLSGAEEPATAFAQRWRKAHAFALFYGYGGATIIFLPARVIWPSEDPSPVLGVLACATCLGIYWIVTQQQRRDVRAN